MVVCDAGDACHRVLLFPAHKRSSLGQLPTERTTMPGHLTSILSGVIFICQPHLGARE
jgi:hypothetical protein